MNGWLVGYFGFNGPLERVFQSISGRLPLFLHCCFTSTVIGGSRVVRRCWVNFQCRGVLLIWIVVGQGPIELAVSAGGGCLDIFFSHLSLLFSFSLSLGDGPI